MYCILVCTYVCVYICSTVLYVCCCIPMLVKQKHCRELFLNQFRLQAYTCYSYNVYNGKLWTYVLCFAVMIIESKILSYCIYTIYTDSIPSSVSFVLLCFLWNEISCNDLLQRIHSPTTNSTRSCYRVSCMHLVFKFVVQITSSLLYKCICNILFLNYYYSKLIRLLLLDGYHNILLIFLLFSIFHWKFHLFYK